MGNGMNKVLPGLYVGNYRDSKDSSQLAKHNITHILAIHDTARRIHSDKHYLCVMASDTPDQNLTQYFSLCNDFIHAARLRDGNVLIHCLAGMSRSVTVAVAYIMSVTTLNWKDALKVVRAGRNVANPNLGFLKQLEEFECTRLIEERRRLKERYPSLALVYKDQEQCALMLNNYEELLQSRSICEGNCALGETCPSPHPKGNRAPEPIKDLSQKCTEVRALAVPEAALAVLAAGPDPALRVFEVWNAVLAQIGHHPFQVVSFGQDEPPQELSGNEAMIVLALLMFSLDFNGIFIASAPPSRSGSRVDLSSSGMNLTAPSTPQCSPPVSPLRRRGTQGRVQVPLALKEDDFDEL
ncbi:hypothetical protein HUJ05_009278 [Dendroctonus ponderosae]|nr:hypothetical protein HUJ05_009278 [Dendroctonus ponderosae]KAH1008750.1 hypothetical protein HUJ05_009278 [Dendroctonus ponderosae]